MFLLVLSLRDCLKLYFSPLRSSLRSCMALLALVITSELANLELGVKYNFIKSTALIAFRSKLLSLA